jgi:hypothetical protein
VLVDQQIGLYEQLLQRRPMTQSPNNPIVESPTCQTRRGPGGATGCCRRDHGARRRPALGLAAASPTWWVRTSPTSWCACCT